METPQSHLLTRPAAIEIAIWLFLAHSASMLFNLIASNGEVIPLFPFSEVQITLKTYLWFLLNYFHVFILYWVIFRIWPDELLKYFAILQGVVMLDFVLTYNSPIFMLFGQNYGILHLILGIKAILIIKRIWKV